MYYPATQPSLNISACISHTFTIPFTISSSASVGSDPFTIYEFGTGSSRINFTGTINVGNYYQKLSIQAQPTESTDLSNAKSAVSQAQTTISITSFTNATASNYLSQAQSTLSQAQNYLSSAESSDSAATSAYNTGSYNTAYNDYMSAESSANSASGSASSATSSYNNAVSTQNKWNQVLKVTTISITSAPSSITYGQASNVSIKLTNALGGLNQQTINLQKNGQVLSSGVTNQQGITTLKIPSTLSAGTYNLNISYSGASNYSSTSTPISLVINPQQAQNGVLTLPSNITYNNQPIPVSYGAGSSINNQLSYSLYLNNILVGSTGSTSGSTYTQKGSNLSAGTYTYSLKTSGNANYTNSTVSKTLVINKAQPKLRLSGIYNFTYNGQGQTIYFNISTVNNQVPANLFVNGYLQSKTNSSSTYITTPSVGTYLVTLSSSTTKNYTSANLSGTFVIGQGEVTQTSSNSTISNQKTSSQSSKNATTTSQTNQNVTNSTESSTSVSQNISSSTKQSQNTNQSGNNNSSQSNSNGGIVDGIISAIKSSINGLLKLF